MKRKIEIAFLVILIAAGITAIFLSEVSRSEREQSAFSSNPSQAPLFLSEITVRNVTDKPIIYRISPQDSKKPPQSKDLPVGAVHRFLSDRTMIIAFEREGHEVTRSLTPGRPYSFRYDENDFLEIWIGSHGREDAEDLAPFVPTPLPVVEKMLELAEMSKDDVVYDIGCGDGRIVIMAAEKYGARGVGIDIDPERIRESKKNAERAGVEKLVIFILENAIKVDLSPATVVTLYLLPESNELLRPKLEKELNPGTRVVSHNYSIPGWKEKEVKSLSVNDNSGEDHNIFVYKR